MTQMLDRFRGCLLGGAIGDALGAPVEFSSAAEIEQRGGVLRAYFSGHITDDTQMTLFTAEGLIKAWLSASSPVGAIHAAYRDWHRTQSMRIPDPFAATDSWLIQHRSLWSQRAPGLTCMSALAASTGPHKAENDSKGCGGVMRVAPVGLASAWPFELAAAAAELTHGHPTSSAASGAFALLISLLIGGATLRDAIAQMAADLSRRPGAEEAAAAISDARQLAVIYPGKGIPAALDASGRGAGWIAEEALAVAIYACLRASDPVKALVLSVEHDGDSDSTGAIAGNILGAALGASWIPADWLQRLELRELINQMAADLLAIKESRASDEMEARYAV